MDIQGKIGRDEYERMKQYFSDIVGGDPQKLEILLNTKLMRFLKGDTQHSYKHTFAGGKRAGQTHTFVYKHRIKRDDRTSRILLPREIEKLFDAGIINEEEERNLQAMLASPDQENIAILEGIINEKRKARLVKETRDRRKIMKTIEEELKNEVDSFSEHIIEVALKNFASDLSPNAQLEPGLFGLVQKEPGKWGIAVLGGLHMLFQDEGSKNLAAMVMRKFCTESKSLATIFVSEAMMSRRDKDAVDENGNLKEGIPRPLEDPEADEVLVFQIETHDSTRLITYGIYPGRILGERNDSGWLRKDQSGKGGRFDNILKDNYSAFSQEISNMLNQSKN